MLPGRVRTVHLFRPACCESRYQGVILAIRAGSKRCISQTTRQRDVVSNCNCHNDAHSRLLIPLCMFLPRHRFGTSLFSTPILLLLRLFYQAASFHLAGTQHASPDDDAPRHSENGEECRTTDAGLPTRTASPVTRLSVSPSPVVTTASSLSPPPVPAAASTASLPSLSETSLPQPGDASSTTPIHPLFTTYSRSSTTSFYRFLLDSPSTTSSPASYHLTSVTWVKALASPLSHEYIQFILLDPSSGSRYRLITDRQEDGDWVHIVGGPGWDASAIYSSPFPPPQPPSTSLPNLNHQPSSVSDVKDGTENASYDAYGHHTLPLPLLSLTFPQDASGPPTTLLDFAAMLAQITAREPRYRLIREHCWWYAEAVFDAAARILGHRHHHHHQNSPPPTTSPTLIHTSTPAPTSAAATGSQLKEWDYAGYRYSFIVRLNTWKLFRREVLVKCAREFRARYMDDFTY